MLDVHQEDCLVSFLPAFGLIVEDLAHPFEGPALHHDLKTVGGIGASTQPLLLSHKSHLTIKILQTLIRGLSLIMIAKRVGMNDALAIFLSLGQVGQIKT